MEKMTNRSRRWKSIVGFQLRVVRGWRDAAHGGGDASLGRIQFLFGHRIKAAGMPRMALSQPHRAHRAATQHAKNANGVSGVFGAAWEEAATRPKHRANAVLIRFDEPKGCDFTDVALAGNHAVTRGAATADFAI